MLCKLCEDKIYDSDLVTYLAHGLCTWCNDFRLNELKEGSRIRARIMLDHEKRKN